MGTIRKIPKLKYWLDKAAGCMPQETAEAWVALRSKRQKPARLILMRPYPPRVLRVPSHRITAAVLMDVMAKARLRAEAKPLPDEPDFDETTKRTILDARAGKNVTRYPDAAAMFADLGI